MARLIDVDKADVDSIRCYYGDHCYLEDVQEWIDDQPTVEAVPVVHGQWIDKPTGAYGRWQSWCSVCGKHSGIGGIESNRHKPYCPNCGNPMDGGA